VATAVRGPSGAPFLVSEVAVWAWEDGSERRACQWPVADL